MNRVKELREEKGLSQEELAKVVGTNRTTISLYESEQRGLSLDMIVKLADYFDVSTDYLLGISEKRNLIEDTRIRLALDTKDYTNITSKQRQQIEEFARFVLKDNLKKKDK